MYFPYLGQFTLAIISLPNLDHLLLFCKLVTWSNIESSCPSLSHLFNSCEGTKIGESSPIRY